REVDVAPVRDRVVVEARALDFAPVAERVDLEDVAAVAEGRDRGRAGARRERDARSCKRTARSGSRERRLRVREPVGGRSSKRLPPRRRPQQDGKQHQRKGGAEESAEKQVRTNGHVTRGYRRCCAAT